MLYACYRNLHAFHFYITGTFSLLRMLLDVVISLGAGIGPGRVGF